MKAATGPRRTCLGCRKTFNPRHLVRFVMSPEKEILVDYRGRLPGRGAYTCPDVRCLRAAVKNKALARALRHPGMALSAEGLTADLTGAVRDKVFSLLGMIRKSGSGVVGSNLVLQKMKAAALPACLVVAEDVSPGIEEKICARARALAIPVHRFGTREELGKVWGRGLVSAVALTPDLLASRFEEEINRFRTISEGY